MPRLLIVDDDEMIRFTLQEICEFAGFESTAVDNGRRALESFRQNQYDAILVDYHMPDMDGIETVKAIRLYDSEVPILVLTVDERQETMNRFVQAGATDFALKPVKAPDLISRININLKLSSIQRKQSAKKKDIMVAKGISDNTLSLIVDYLKTQSQPVTIEEITDGVGLAYPTVHRYISYLLEEEQVQVVPHYRKVGRPKNSYIWNTDTPSF